MPTPLEELAPVPKAPHPPDIEDVLGPPPRAPRIGRGGPIGSARRGRSTGGRPPSPPHLAKPSQPAPQQASQPVRQTIIQEVKPAPYKPPVATPETTPKDNQQYTPPRGMGNRPRTRRAAAAASARQSARDWRARAGQPAPAEGQGEGMSPEVRAKRAQQYADMKGTLDALRQPANQPNEPASGEANP